MTNKVLVFGGSGFLGSHVADQLSKNNYKVTIVDIKKSKYIKKNQNFILEDISNIKPNNKLFKSVKFIYNFSGISDISEAKNDPIGTIKNNILNNMILLESCSHNSINRYIFASSVYSNSRSGNFYSISKKTCEDYIHSFCNMHKLNFTILRYGSLYGLRSNYNNGIYKFIYDAINKNKIIFNGSSEAIREFINVEDAAASSLEALSNKFVNKTVTLTGQQLLKIKDLHLMIKEILNNKKLKIKYLNKEDQHYRVTPYSYERELSKKLTPKLHIDLGEGLLQVIREIDNEKKD